MGSVYVNTLYGERIDLLMFENRNASEELEMVRKNWKSQKKPRIGRMWQLGNIHGGGRKTSMISGETIQMEISKQAKKMWKP